MEVISSRSWCFTSRGQASQLPCTEPWLHLERHLHKKNQSVLLLQQFSFSFPSPLAQGRRSHLYLEFKQLRKGLVPLLFGWKHLKFFGVNYIKVIILPTKSPGKIQPNKRTFNPINFKIEAIIWQLNTNTLLALFTAELPVTSVSVSLHGLTVQNCGTSKCYKTCYFCSFCW